MKFDIATRGTGWLGAILYGTQQPGQANAAYSIVGRLTRQGLAVVLSALMIMIPMGQSNAFAQNTLPGVDQSAPPPMDNGQAPPQAQPLGPDQLDQLVAPMALYPDNLVAQVLAASTYPTQVVEADRWLKSQGNAPAAQIAAGANSQPWDASVKALTAFPQVLDQMDKNLQWTTDLGNAYYNQPQDVMDAVQAMRQKAQSAGNLRSTPQLAVNNSGGDIVIAPTNPAVVYVPVYNPWTVWGGPIVAYPGFYYAPAPGIFWGGLAIGFGIGIGIGIWGGWGWGWGHWGCGWHGGYGGYRGVYYNHNSYYTHSTTVINRGYNRPGSPGGAYGARGAYAHSAGGYNHAGGTYGHANGGAAARSSTGFNHTGATGTTARSSTGYNHAGSTATRSGGYNQAFTTRSGSAGASRVGSTFGHTATTAGRPAGTATHAAPSGGHSFGGGHAGGGGHGGHR